MNDDLRELLASLNSANVEFLVIGAHAVGFYARPRMTEDIDLWVNPTPENAERLKDALAAFGAPIGDAGAKKFHEGTRDMIRLGVPPNMVDILNFASSKGFAETWQDRVAGALDGVELFFPSRSDLIRMKREVGRPQDLADVARLEAQD
jgi:hypothetical protein